MNTTAIISSATSAASVSTSNNNAARLAPAGVAASGGVGVDNEDEIGLVRDRASRCVCDGGERGDFRTALPSERLTHQLPVP